MRLIALAALLAVPAVASAEVNLRMIGGRVDLHARAPLPEVLDRLSKQTGLKIVYDGAPPRTMVTVSVQGVTTAQAVLQVLQGLGLDYALQMDATGTQAATLVLVNSGTRSPSLASAPTSGAPSVNADDGEQAEDADTDADQPVEDQPKRLEQEQPPPAPPEPAPAAAPFPGGPQPSWSGTGAQPLTLQPGLLAPSPFTVTPNPPPTEDGKPTSDSKS